MHQIIPKIAEYEFITRFSSLKSMNYWENLGLEPEFSEVPANIKNVF